MSALYNLEPQPNASCILHTTSGDISLELWAQQVPLTCRNFLQHCVDGYYNNTIFHRLVPGFILQGGDPSGTGSGGESIYDGGAFSEAREEGGIWPLEDRKGQNAGKLGVGFKDEFHSRIKFNRRGLLGMANEGPDTNGSQFFLTLGETPELQGRNTCFGRVQGDTIYNVARMGEAELGEGERPTYPTRITGAEVLVNPFKDMIIRNRVAPVLESEKLPEKKKKRKAGKQLLSFDGDEGGHESMPLIKKAKFDTRIVMDTNEAETKAEVKLKSKAASKDKKRTERTILRESSPEPPPPPKDLPNRAPKLERHISWSPEPVQKVSSLLERTNAQIAELTASMKRNIHTAPVPEKKKSALEQMIPATSVRGRKRKAGKASAQSDNAALGILKAFREKLSQAPAEKATSKATPPAEDAPKDAADDDEAALCDLHFIANCRSCNSWDAHAGGGEDGDNDDKGWMSHALSFEKDRLGKDLSYRKKAEEELVVIDPRAKERTLKEEKRAEKEARSGGSSRQWDQARNRKMARSAAI